MERVPVNPVEQAYQNLAVAQAAADEISSVDYHSPEARAARSGLLELELEVASQEWGSAYDIDPCSEATMTAQVKVAELQTRLAECAYPTQSAFRLLSQL